MAVARLTISEGLERCLLKWFHLSALPLTGAKPASCIVVTLRLRTRHVNMSTQYVVDIRARTHDVAPALQQDAKLVAIEGAMAGIGESCGNPSRKRKAWLWKRVRSCAGM